MKWGTPPPKRNRFPLQESSRMVSRKGREALIHRGEEEKSLGGGTWVKSRKWGFQLIPRKKCWPHVSSSIFDRGERTPSASLRLQSPPSHLCFFFFPTCFRISLHPSRPQTVEFGCASGCPALQILPIDVFCFSAKAEPGCSSLLLNSLSWEIFFFSIGRVFLKSPLSSPKQGVTNALFLLRHQMRDKDHSRHLLPTVWGFFFLKARLAFLSSYVQSSLKPALSL